MLSYGIELPQTPPSLAKLEQLNEASRLGYDAGRLLRDIALGRVNETGSEALDKVLEFAALVLRELEPTLGSTDVHRARAYAPEELARRFVENGRTREDLTAELRKISRLVRAKMDSGSVPDPSDAVSIYEQIWPLTESYVQEAGIVAEQLTAV